MLLFEGYIILHIKNPKDPKNNKKLLKLTNEFSKIAGYKINIQKSVVFLYSNYDRSEKEMKRIKLLLTNIKDNDKPMNKFNHRSES